MFDELIESFHAKTKAVSDSIDSLNQDISDIRDIFVETRDTIGGIFGFIGQETALLLLFTLVFLFVINLIPFFFFDKKTRYYVGIAFGVFLGVYFDYAYPAIGKFIIIMMIPLGIEFILVLAFRGAKKIAGGTVKKVFSFVWGAMLFPFKLLFSKVKKKREALAAAKKSTNGDEKGLK